ncbi:MAG TPA: hypothetical protein PLK94_11160 [Alphaproteobacteria bacterium]|nr:hypothetical protein [Alphaproteobacteria bacterium]HOO51835.1 hypothetical protein [Alphaproteobacteria bacterium]
MRENESKVIVRRYEYEEPYHIQLEFIISNGKFSSTVDIYCTVDDVRKIGESLFVFPKKMNDEYSFVYGSENPEDNFDKFFSLKAYTVDGSGHCALQFKVNLNEVAPSEGKSVFSLLAETSEINRLGKLFITFSKLKHKEFQWSGNRGELFEEHQYIY